MGKHYFLKFDERGNQCLYDERGNKLVCGDIYDILDYVRSRGGGIIYVEETPSWGWEYRVIEESKLNGMGGEG